MPTRLVDPGFRATDANGTILSGAKLYIYEAGTSTPKPAFSDAALTIPHANPIVADAGGRFGDVFAGAGEYKLVLQTAGGGSVWTADPVDGSTGSATEPGAGIRNLLINGDFSLNQRGATSVADDTYCFDNWYVLTSTGNVTVAQQTLQTAGIATNIRLTQPSGSAKKFGLAQIVEAANCRFLRGSSVVQSIRLRHSVAAPLRYAILSWTGTADSVTSDVVNDWSSTSYAPGDFFLASNLTVQAVGSVTPAANTWTSVPPLSAVLSASLNNLILFCWTEGDTAQNATLDFGLWQAEQGTTPTAFEYLPFDAQLARATRYYEKSFPIGTAPAQNAGLTGATIWGQPVGASLPTRLDTVGYRTRKRIAATPTLYNPEAANGEIRNADTPADCSSSGATGTEWGFDAITTTPSGSAVGERLAVHWAVSADL